MLASPVFQPFDREAFAKRIVVHEGDAAELGDAVAFVLPFYHLSTPETVATVGVLTYFGNNLGPSVDWLAWSQDVSPVHYYSGGEPLRNGFQALDSLVLVGAALILVALAAIGFERRDVAV